MTNSYKVAGPESRFDPNVRMTEKQAVQLRELCAELDEPFDDSLSERQAARRIAAMEEMAD